jgi:hypothetical protein
MPAALKATIDDIAALSVTRNVDQATQLAADSDVGGRCRCRRLVTVLRICPMERLLDLPDVACDLVLVESDLETLRWHAEPEGHPSPEDLN